MARVLLRDIKNSFHKFQLNNGKVITILPLSSVKVDEEQLTDTIKNAVSMKVLVATKLTESVKPAATEIKNEEAVIGEAPSEDKPSSNGNGSKKKDRNK